MRTADWSASITVLDRLTAVFEAFGPRDDGLGVSELARRANLPKSTVSRIAAELVEQGFLERHDDKLFLGVRLYELGQNVVEPRRLRRLARPVMAELRDLTGRTVTLALVQGGYVVHIAVLRGRSSVASLGGVGTRLPANDSALARSVLSSPSSPGAARPPHVCVVADERGTGLTHVAAPVLERGSPIAALSVCAPDAEADPDALAPVLLRAAWVLGRRAGATGGS